MNVQEEQIEKLNYECNNKNKKIESLEKENNTLTAKLETATQQKERKKKI